MNGVSVQMVFSPQTCSLERLEATLTPERRALADRILAQAQQSVATGASYNNLIIGARGTGKTHVVAYIRRRIEAQTAEGVALNVISLAEEERGIASVVDFVVACLRGAGVPSEDIIARVAGDPATLRERALAFFREVTEAKPTWIIVENLSDVFGHLAGDPLDHLRSFLQEHAFVSLLGSSVQLFEDSSRADHPFYGYFFIHPLEGLDAEGARGYLRLLAQANADADLAAALGRKQAQARVNAIYHLTGGNHRLLAMLSIFLTADGLTELVGPFLEMTDRELTPYYQQRLDRLAPQQYKIVQAIAEELGQALSVNEVARRALLSPQAVSRQLHDLLHAGFVQRQPVGRESFYDLHEPLLRIVLDMKTGRDQPLPLIVDLLKQWYEPHELRDLEAHADDPARVYYRMALADTEPRGVQQGIAERIGTPVPAASGVAVVGDQESALLQEAEGLRTHGKFAEALEKLDRLLTLEPNHSGALAGRGWLLAACGRDEEAVAASEEFLARFGDSEQSQLFEQLAGVLVNKGTALARLERWDEALAVYNEVVRRFGESEHHALLEAVAVALVNRGLVIADLGRPEEAFATCEEVERRFGESDQPALLEKVANALVNKGLVLGDLGRPEEACATCEEVVRRFGESDQRGLLRQVARALVNKGVVLGDLGRGEDALAICEEMVRRFGESDQPALLEGVARTLNNKGVVLRDLGRPQEAWAAYEEVVRRFGESNQPALLEQVAMALVNKGVVLKDLGRPKEALDVCEEVVRRFGESDEPVLLEGVARALFGKGAALRELGEPEGALAALEEVVRRFGESDEPALLKGVGKALFSKGLALSELGRPEEALAAYEEVVRRFGESDQPALLEQVAMALVNKGNLLRLEGRREQALSAYEAALVIRPDDRLGRPLRARMLFELGRHTEALHEAREILGSPTREPSDSGLLASLLLEVAADNAHDLREVRAAFGEHEEALVGGLTAWVQSQLPMSEDSARKLEDAEAALRSMFEDVPQARPLLDILAAARRDALGDKKALLTLPVELRRLIEQAKEKGTDAAKG